MRKIVAGLLFICGAISGCAMVKPYKRGDLARPCVAQDELRMKEKLDGHVTEYREGTIGGNGVGVGGCGCN